MTPTGTSQGPEVLVVHPDGNRVDAGTERAGADLRPVTDRLLQRAGRPLAALAGAPHALTWVGVAVAAAGFGVLAYTWGRVAALGNVALQVPYVVSGGAGGLGMLVVGLALVGIAARRADSAERSRQLRELRDVLADLRSTLEERRR